ncbi:dihydrolipoamide acetyltransferase family protein [Photobacterium rosenbergii]|uniref:Dihydrolipoamide acetyltransferase component of pyruvate dehydrogenase complex n=1 Tax=Photobacterium rosenbergii TaxID=294936 RepID=A0ABU3ZJL1_9GAMM|nr:dihydrolipoamide acetyltransferase family protein [Photobacterium rosenbergii]MDV5170287.1 dihydrolipoamide acetyltransferase family protein [Photobacterium rosenbergii]
MDKMQSEDTLIDITMPALGADMHDGTLVEWQVNLGDEVQKGDIIAVIETSKGAIDMESYHDGTITDLLVEPEIKLPVGSVMARMTTAQPANTEPKANESQPSAPKPNSNEPTSAFSEDNYPFPPFALARQHKNNDQHSTRVLISPAARHRVEEDHLDVSYLHGSGPEGAIVLRDLPPQIPTGSKTKTSTKSSQMRQAISEAMSRSKQQIPHYYLSLEADLSKAEQWLVQYNQQREPEDRMLLSSLVITAIARQLTKYPSLNGYYIKGEFIPSPAVNIGNAISLREGGLVVPAIINADELSLEQVMIKLKELAERGRHGHLRSTEITDATITVTSIGERGADMITGIIYPPQVAIIGLGRLRDAPVVNNGTLTVGSVMTITLAADHRVSDGIIGARFLHSVAKQLQKPEALYHD